MTSKHTTSIVDISEIEDDEAPLAPNGAGNEQSSKNQATSSEYNQSSKNNDNINTTNNSHHNYSNKAHKIYQQTGTGGSSAAHLYLYHEDLHPHQRIPNLLSSMINTQQQPSTGSSQPNIYSGGMDHSPGQTLIRASASITAAAAAGGGGNSNLKAIDYYPNNSSLNDQQQPTVEEPGASGHSTRPTTPAVYATNAGSGNNSSNNSEKQQQQQQQQSKANLGTLSGVYFPCVQNIFGVILFIRMVWIVGTAGVPAAFSLVFICCCVTLTTSISLSAIATNGIVPAGGSYHMISRSLGPECGGAVGTLFWFGTTVAGAMYITGAVEIMLNYLAPSWGLFGDFQRDVNIMYNNIRVYGSLLLIIVGGLVWIGVKFVSKLAPIALFCVLFSIFSIYAGIFINYNGRSDLFICVVGDRLVTLKNIPYDDPVSPQFSMIDDNNNQQQQQQQQQFQQSYLNNSKLTKAERESLYQMRRTKALCTFDKLRYIFCPNEQAQQQQQQLTGDQQQESSINQQSTSGSGQSEQQLAEAQMMRDLFKRPPNMSNCDPYFSANRQRIHLEKAVPGIASGVLFSNLKTRFRNSGNVVSYDDGFNIKSPSGYNNVFVDITTSFTILISIYFPSCTGILAGSNRSGDLADAQKSIPRGTIAAQLTTSFVYLSCIVLFGSTFNNLFIRDKFGESMGGQLAVTQIAWPHPYVILIGGLLSTLGASLQSLVGAPRILQGIAKDEVIPCFNRFAKLSPRGEPETAIIFTLAISWLAVLIGNLDFIAPILTISLVMCYFFINLACTLHSLLGSPNWRPRFKHYHWSISLLGCFLCLFVMIVSSWIYFGVATFIAIIIYKYIELTGAIKEWGDGKQGLALSAAIYNLLRLKTSEPHTKNWRPQLLLFCKLKPASELEPPSAKINSNYKHQQQQQQRYVRQPAITSGSGLNNNNNNNNLNNQYKQIMYSQDDENNNNNNKLVLAHRKLLTFASQLKAGKGLTLVSSIIEGDFKELAPLAQKARSTLQDCLQEEKVRGFADVLIAPSIQEGLSYQIQTAGLGGLKHNTVIVGWPDWRRRSSKINTTTTTYNKSSASFIESQQQQQQQQRGSFKTTSTSSGGASGGPPLPPKINTSIVNSKAHQFIELMRNVQVSQNALLVVKGVDQWPESCDRLGGYIDIWWIVNDGGLLMLLPHLLKQHRTWKSCQLRIFTVAHETDNSVQMREDLKKFLYHLRIEAEVDIVEMYNTEISDYAYERTLIMEQRAEIIKRFNVNRKQSLLFEEEIDGVIKLSVRKPSISSFEDKINNSTQFIPQLNSPTDQNNNAIVGGPSSSSKNGGENYQMVELSNARGGDHHHHHQQQEADQQQSRGNFLSNIRPDELNLKRMQSALTLNKAIVDRSKNAKLVIIDLPPGALKELTPEGETNYMEFVEIITEKLDRVLLVQNGGREVITIHS